MTRVLPLPAPARISTGPSVVSTASRCCGFSWSRKDNAEVAPGIADSILQGNGGGGMELADFGIPRTGRARSRAQMRILIARHGGHVRSFCGVEMGRTAGRNPHPSTSSGQAFSRRTREMGHPLLKRFHQDSGRGRALIRPGGTFYAFECESEDFSGFGGADDGGWCGASRPARCASGRSNACAGLQSAGADPAWKSDGVSGGRGEELSDRRVHDSG